MNDIGNEIENEKVDLTWTSPEDLQPLIEQNQLLYYERRRTIRSLLGLDVYEAAEYDILQAIIKLKNELAELQQQRKQDKTGP